MPLKVNNINEIAAPAARSDGIKTNNNQKL
jgi:hypothetical protein